MIRKTDYNDPRELRQTAEAFDWLEQWMPEVRELILAKFCPSQLDKPSLSKTIGGAIIMAEIHRNRE